MSLDISSPPGRRARKSHIWDRQVVNWYVEPTWISQRLFAVEPFRGTVFDPACGMGRILDAAKAAGHTTRGSDLVDRGARTNHSFVVQDFLGSRLLPADNIVTNPPFDIVPVFVPKAVAQASRKVAIVFPVPRLNAAGGKRGWLGELPLARIWFLTPRPSMPPGDVILRGEKPSGGKEDFCCLVFDKAHRGPSTCGWLHRD